MQRRSEEGHLRVSSRGYWGGGAWGGPRSAGAGLSGEAFVEEHAPGGVGGGDVGVEPGWWGEGGEAVVGDGDCPGGVVDEAVVVPAEQHEVGEGGGSAVCPEPDVVGVAPGGWDVAAGECAVLVAGGQRAADAEGDGAGCPADVQRLGGGGEDGGDDVGVAGQPPQGFDRDGGAGLQGGGCVGECGLQLVVGAVHEHGRAGAAAFAG